MTASLECSEILDFETHEKGLPVKAEIPHAYRQITPNSNFDPNKNLLNEKYRPPFRKNRKNHHPFLQNRKPLINRYLPQPNKREWTE
jgi:hypothetical protein